MPSPMLTYFFGNPLVSAPWSTVDQALTGSVSSVSQSRITLADNYGHKIVFTGEFDLNGGDVAGGTVTGFSAFLGGTELIEGKGYAMGAVDLLDALALAKNGNANSFWDLVRKVPLTQVGSAQDDEIWGTGKAGIIFAGAGDDRVYGGDGNELIKGGPGDDLLIGSYGFDRMFGGAGKDVFTFCQTDAVDIAKDFSPKDDLVALADLMVPELGPGFVAKSEFHIGASATRPGQHLIYNPSNGALFYDGDGSKVEAAIQIGQLPKHLELTSHSFFVTGDYDLK